ncbi:MAG: hypothetical protein HUU60_04895 [Armatimonadetes bacterium]|nr:hypothetical protein [Armatimonadota bacterium]
MDDGVFIITSVGIMVMLILIGIGIMIRLVRAPKSLPQSESQRQWTGAIGEELKKLRSSTTEHSLSLQERLDHMEDRLKSMENRIGEVEAAQEVQRMLRE